jgi:hypothetical protein
MTKADELLELFLRAKERELEIEPELINSILEEIITDEYLLYIDTSGFLHENCHKVFQDEIIPYLEKYNIKLHIPINVLSEIDMLIHQHGIDVDIIDQAISASYIIKNLEEKDLVCYFTSFLDEVNICMIINTKSYNHISKNINNYLLIPSFRKIKFLAIKDERVFEITQ